MIIKTRLLAVLSSVALFSSACAGHHVTDQYEHQDGLESFNRAMFSFNYKLDKYILKPVAKGYRAVTTKDVRNRVSSALNNVTEPVAAFSQVLQGDFKQSGISLSRFAINTTLGLAGTFDVASGWGLKSRKDSFENVLANWCVGEGSYLVLPFIGSTTPRAMLGKTVDSFITPAYWMTKDHEDGMYGYAAYVGMQAIVAREASLELGDDLERNSVDLYTTMKSAYLQNKSKMNRCACEGNNATSYDFDFNDSEDEE